MPLQPSGSSSLDVPQFLCTSQLLAERARRTPDALALLAPGRAPLTYSHLRRHVDDVVQILSAMRVGRSDRVALVLPDGPELAVAFLAVAASATCAPLNPAYSANEFDFYLAALRASALIVWAGMDSPVQAVAQARCLPIIELSPVIEAEAGIFTLTGVEQEPTALHGCAQPDNVAVILHTSGTTSRSKLVPLTHANICTRAHSIWSSHKLVEGDRCLNVMPLFHGHGLISTMLASLVAGASVVCTPGFSGPKFFPWMAEFQPTWYSAVPTIHQAILARAAVHREVIVGCPLRFIRSGTAPLPSQVLSELRRVFNAPVLEVYGLLEASVITCNPLPPWEAKLGSVGVTIGPEVAIMGEVGTLLPTGATGEIVVRGATVIHSYDNDPSANKMAFTHGWLRTGDQGFLDIDGYLFVTGRLKELINRGGEKISPREVEEVLMEHPAVAEVVTFAMPHAQLGEDVAAAIVLRENTSATSGEIRAFAAPRLADFKVPRQVVFVSEIPKGATGKVQRLGLAERLGLPARDQRLPAEQAGYTAPRTPVEAELAEIWAQVLGLKRVGIHDDFFELGGDSLQALNLFAQIESVFGKHLPLPALFQAPTIAQLASLLSQEGCSTPWSPLVAIQPGGSNPPFFCVHPHGGHVLVFKDLARHLGSDQPFYGLQAQGLDGTQAPHSRVEDMAAHYLQAIRTVQPEGPYFLGGYCLGGIVAFEMAQQLHAQGERVALLALLDAYAPGSPKLLPWGQRTKHRIARHVGTLRRLGPREQLHYVLARGKLVKARIGRRLRAAWKSSLGMNSPVHQALRQVEEANLRALSHYIPKVYPAKMILFRPSKRYAEYYYYHDLHMGWGELAAGSLESHEIPGYHQDIIREPWVRVLAEQLRICLHKAQAVGLERGAPYAHRRG